ncbi:heavy metal translocating P-type ATPase [Streptomyces sp. NPDC102462]|uniref:heavy metal translocating P-type ATPase n=1 Tax=Streptomyces sp. NPDC102462 TaxID=3366178 RepID=UPI003810E25F
MGAIGYRTGGDVSWTRAGRGVLGLVGWMGVRTAGSAGRAAAGAAGAVGVAAGGVTAVGWRVARRTGSAGASAARHGGSAAAALPRRAIHLGQALVDLHPRRHVRRVWTGHGRAHIEVRGLDRGDRGGPGRERLSRGVTRSLRGLSGVRWAEVNAVTGQVLLSFDERRVGVDRLLDTVRAVEDAHGVRDAEFAWAQPVTPGDDVPVATAATQLLVDCAAVAAAVVQRVLRLPVLPRAVPAAVAALELERELRGPLVRRIGPVQAELLMSLTSATVNGLCDGVGMPMVDAVSRAFQFGEMRARRRVWERRERELCPGPDCVPRTRPARHLRARARRSGPVERWEARLAPFAPLTAASVLALTGSPGRAADALLVAVPRAARYGREGFAAAVGRDLARHGVVPLDPSALRLLDLVSAVVIDSALLVNGRGPEGGLHPLTVPVLAAARSTGARVVLTGDARVRGLSAPAEQITGAGERVADRVRELQRQGEAVLVVSGTDAEALATADVAVAVPGEPGAEASWSADLVSLNGLEDAWRVLRAVTAARTVSQRSVRLAFAASALGVLLSLLGRRRGVLHALTPMHIASLIALLWAAATARRAARTPAATASP